MPASVLSGVWKEFLKSEQLESILVLDPRHGRMNIPPLQRPIVGARNDLVRVVVFASGLDGTRAVSKKARMFVQTREKLLNAFDHRCAALPKHLVGVFR